MSDEPPTQFAETLFDRRNARRDARHRRQLGYVYAAAGSVAAIVAVIFGIALGVSFVDEWQLAARWTARVSLHLFAVLFVLGAIEQIYRIGASTEMFRIALRAFAGSHAIYAVALAVYASSTYSPPGAALIIAGTLGFIALLVLLVCTSMTIGALLGDDLRRGAMTASLWYLWALFAGAYANRLVDGQSVLFSSYALLLCLAVASVWLIQFVRQRANR